MNPEITVMARAKAKAGYEKVLEEALKKVVPLTHQESGCVKYILHRSNSDPTDLLVIERWLSKSDWEGHMSKPYILELFEKVPGLVAAPPEITVFECVEAGGHEKGQF